MVKQTEIESIDREYFDIIEARDYVLVLRSRNTGHFWCLLEQEYNGHRFFQISHRHHAENPYHIQKSRPTIADCCEYIQSHDAYHLKKERRKEESRQRRQEEKRKKEPSPGIIRGGLF